MPFSDQRIPAPFILPLYQDLVGRLDCAASDWHPSGVDFGISHAVLMLSEEVEHAGDGLPAGMLLREVSQRADDLADAVLPFLQGFAERLEPVPRLRRSLPVGGVQRLFQMLQGVPTMPNSA